jgi:hypothetical protein
MSELPALPGKDAVENGDPIKLARKKPVRRSVETRRKVVQKSITEWLKERGLEDRKQAVKPVRRRSKNKVGLDLQPALF